MRTGYIGYYQVSTGQLFWSSPFESHKDETNLEIATNCTSKSKAEMLKWSDDKKAGIFVIGPLPGIVKISSKPLDHLNTIQITALWIELNKLPTMVMQDN